MCIISFKTLIYEKSNHKEPFRRVLLGQKEFQRDSFYPGNFKYVPFGRFSTLPGWPGEFQAGCIDPGGDVGRGFLAVEVWRVLQWGRVRWRSQGSLAPEAVVPRRAVARGVTPEILLHDKGWGDRDLTHSWRHEPEGVGDREGRERGSLARRDRVAERDEHGCNDRSRRSLHLVDTRFSPGDTFDLFFRGDGDPWGGCWQGGDRRRDETGRDQDGRSSHYRLSGDR